jgi:hypothetical protein
MRLIVDMVAFCADVDPEVEPDERLLATTCRRPARRRCRRSPTRSPPPSACSTPCATRGQVARRRFAAGVRAISFFVNAGIRFVEETCKMRAFTELWDRIGLERYGVTDAKPGGSATACRSTARPHRGPAREQRAAHRARDARRHPVARRPGPPSSCRRGTRRSACRARGTSSGRCGCSRSWPTRPTCSSTTTSSRARW